MLILFPIFLSQNIITSWNYDKVQMYDLQKINKFLLSEFGDKVYDLSNVIMWNNIKISDLKLINIETSLYDSYLNYNNGIFLLSPNKIIFYFNFSYSESTLGLNDTATLELKIETLKIKIVNNKTSQEPKITVKMSSPMNNYNVPGIKDKSFLAKLQDALYSGFQMQSILSRTLSDKISEGLLNYYIEFYSNKKEFIIQSNEFFGNYKFSMNNNKFLYFCEDLIGEYKNSFCYYYGYSEKEEKEDKTKAPIENERFSHNPDDLYNIFINKDLINNITSYISKMYFDSNPKIYNNGTNIKQLSYDFTVASLKKYFSGLEDLEDGDYFYCQVFIDSITLNEAIYRVKFNINKINFVIKINSKINIDLPIINNIRFNLCLKESKTSNIEVVSQEPKIEITDVKGLKNAIDESFDYDYNKICLFDNGLSLRDYLTKIKNIYYKDEGLYIEGDHLYQ